MKEMKKKIDTMSSEIKEMKEDLGSDIKQIKSLLKEMQPKNHKWSL